MIDLKGIYKTKSSGRSPNKGKGRASPGKRRTNTHTQPSGGGGPRTTQRPLSKAEALKDNGNREFKKGRYERAVEYYSRSLQEDGTAYAVYANRSAAYVQMKKWRKALTDADKSIALSKGWWKGYVRKSNVFSAQKNFNEAQRVLLGALRLCTETQPLNVCIYGNGKIYIYS